VGGWMEGEVGREVWMYGGIEEWRDRWTH